MRIHPTAALALLALLLGSTVAFAPAVKAQDRGPGDAPDQMGRPDGPRQGRRGGGEWGKGGERGERERGGRGMHGRERGEREFMLARLVSNPEIREKLGVTAEQAAKIRQQTSDFRKAEIRSRAEADIKRIELRDLLSAEKPDKAAIDRKLEEIGTARLTREKAAVDFHLAMRNALTPEQREKLKKLREEWRNRGRGEGREGARGPRGGERRGRPDAPGGPAGAPAPPKGED